MGRGSVYAVSLGPTYAVTAHHEKVSNLTKMSKKTTYVIICFLEVQMRTTYGKISLGNQRVSHAKVPPPIRFHTESDGCNVLLVNREIQQTLKCYSKVILIYRQNVCHMVVFSNMAGTDG